MSHSRAQREPKAVFLFLSLVSCCSYYEYRRALLYKHWNSSNPRRATTSSSKQQQAAAAAAVEAGIPRSCASPPLVTSNVLPTMSVLAVAGELNVPTVGSLQRCYEMSV